VGPIHPRHQQTNQPPPTPAPCHPQEHDMKLKV
jgi:hypothetical protein